MNKIPVTVNGYRQMTEELEKLKNQERPGIIAAIAEARAHGDLRENAEYHSAKEKQGFIEGRIRELESKLSNSQVIDIGKLKNEGKVIFGSTVTLCNVIDETLVTYQIVGEDEADLKRGKISVTSPLARALIGKAVDEEVEVTTPQGKKIYEIVKVEYI
ncbi:MAG: transcription elongation factor GreA [Proteobacteria bacterium]|nr:transcription elongation factor GreA [Pseudomonadota bacterium]